MSIEDRRLEFGDGRHARSGEGQWRLRLSVCPSSSSSVRFLFSGGMAVVDTESGPGTRPGPRVSVRVTRRVRASGAIEVFGSVGCSEDVRMEKETMSVRAD